MEHYSWKDCEETKFEKGKRVVKETLNKGGNKVKTFWKENKVQIVALAPFALGTLHEVNKMNTQRRNQREEARREQRIYDPSMGDYWELKRPLTNNERLEFERRVANGELRGNVLRDMNKLRR